LAQDEFCDGEAERRTGACRVKRQTQKDIVLLQAHTSLLASKSTVLSKSQGAAVAMRMKAYNQNPSSFASGIQCGIQAILSSTMAFSVEPPRIADGIMTLGEDLFKCIEMMMPPEQQNGYYGDFKSSWTNAFVTITDAAASIEADLELYAHNGHTPVLIRAISTIIGESGIVVSSFLPTDLREEVMKYLRAVVETLDAMGSSWDEFSKGNTVEGIEAIYWGLRGVTDSVMPDELRNDEVYNTIIGTLDFVLGNLSHHVLEYERLIMESSVCWRTEKMRGRERPPVCPENYVTDGAGMCYPLYHAGSRVIPAQCDMDSQYTEKHGHQCYSPCRWGWQDKPGNIHKCVSACEGKFPAETDQMCGRDQGMITKAIMEMVTVVLNSAFTLTDRIMQMQEHGVNAERLSSTIQVFIDMGKPFAKPTCPEGVAPTPAPNPLVCSKPCTIGAPPGRCRIETGGMVVCLPSNDRGECAAGQLTCLETPPPTPMLETPHPTPQPPDYGGRRRGLAHSCCAKCGHRHRWCSPGSGNCYARQNKPYYQKCPRA